MIMNFSTLDLYEQCQHKYLNRHIRRLRPPPMVTLERGSGGHRGIAHFHKTGDVHEAVELAEHEIREEMDAADLLAEEVPEWERAIISAREGVRQYAERYSRLDYTVLRTEVNFLVPIPGTTHHCWFLHEQLLRSLGGGPAYHVCPGAWPQGYSCQVPYYLAGVTDAVISMTHGSIWLLDHKFSGMKQGIFFKQYLLDMQGTLYCWGVQESTGITPRGFIINKLNMPWRNQSADNVTIESEPYPRVHQDYQRMLHWAVDIGTEIEAKLSSGREPNLAFRVSPRACTDYNRTCWYQGLCQEWDDPSLFSNFALDPLRYHDIGYFDLLWKQGLRWSETPDEIKDYVIEEGLKQNLTTHKGELHNVK